MFCEKKHIVLNYLLKHLKIYGNMYISNFKILNHFFFLCNIDRNKQKVYGNNACRESFFYVNCLRYLYIYLFSTIYLM